MVLMTGVHGPHAQQEKVEMQGESLVLVGMAPGKLCFGDIVPGTVTVRSTYEPDHPEAVVYLAEQDYTVDHAAGTITRTEGSRIPDFGTNVLHGQKEFDHTKFPGYGNTPFFVFVDYVTRAGFPLTEPSDQAKQLRQTRARLSAGGPFKIVVFGDSISVGGEATAQHLQFSERYADWLRPQFPDAAITLENGATGGDATPQGLQRLEEKVLSRAPDLVLMGFGMNDHNKGSVEPEQFEKNLISLIETTRTRTGAEILLYSTFPPNPDWKHSSHRMEQYAAATRRAAEATGSAYADVHGVFEKVLRRKDFPSFLANNINHPNDFGHWLYYQALISVAW